VIRFLHTSDWQLGMTRHFFSEGVQERFAQSRFDAIRELGRVAEDENCRFMVVCGDVFESILVDRKTVFRALEALKDVSIPVYLLPGNHDPLNAASVYRSVTFLDRKPAHVHVIEDTIPIPIDKYSEIIGIPWTSKRPQSAKPVDNHASPMPSPRRETKPKEDKAKRVLHVWLNLANPFLTQGNIFTKADIKSASTQSSIKKVLLRRGLILEHKVQLGKNYTCIWEPTEKAYETVDRAKPRLKSKGGYLHQFIAHHICSWAKKHGYRADIEFMLSNNKAVDLVLRASNEVIFVEIAVSPPLEKEIVNVVKDFASELIPTGLVMVVTDSKTREKLEQLMDSDKRVVQYRENIRMELAGKFIIDNKLQQPKSD